MAKMKTKGQEQEVPGTSHDCAICGNKSVIRQSDGRYYCFEHHDQYCTGKSFEKLKEIYDARQRTPKT